MLRVRSPSAGPLAHTCAAQRREHVLAVDLERALRRPARSVLDADDRGTHLLDVTYPLDMDLRIRADDV